MADSKNSGKAEPSQEQTKQEYDNLSKEQKEKQTYTEWLRENYNYQYERWMPWIEDQYLKWFGKGDNKASYATKGLLSHLPFPHLKFQPTLTSAIPDALSKTKVTGVKQVDQLQDDVNNLVGNQLGTNGLLAPVGNMMSKEGVNRAERGGKDDKGTYGGPVASYSDPVIKNAQSAGQGMAGGAQKVGSSITDGAKGAGGYLGGMLGGGKKSESEA
jgi:hypothetical protein